MGGGVYVLVDRDRSMMHLTCPCDHWRGGRRARDGARVSAEGDAGRMASTIRVNPVGALLPPRVCRYISGRSHHL